MILLIGGGTHTGKTLAAQRALEKYSYPYLSIDHLKMGLIRSGICPLAPESPDEELTPFLWSVIREIVKTAMENGQNLVVEGCYIPFDWKKDFTPACREQIRYVCLIFQRIIFKGITMTSWTMQTRLSSAWMRRPAHGRACCVKTGTTLRNAGSMGVTIC